MDIFHGILIFLVLGLVITLLVLKYTPDGQKSMCSGYSSACPACYSRLGISLKSSDDVNANNLIGTVNDTFDALMKEQGCKKITKTKNKTGVPAVGTKCTDYFASLFPAEADTQIASMNSPALTAQYASFKNSLQTSMCKSDKTVDTVKLQKLYDNVEGMLC